MEGIMYSVDQNDRGELIVFGLRDAIDVLRLTSCRIKVLYVMIHVICVHPSYSAAAL